MSQCYFDGNSNTFSLRMSCVTESPHTLFRSLTFCLRSKEVQDCTEEISINRQLRYAGLYYIALYYSHSLFNLRKLFPRTILVLASNYISTMRCFMLVIVTLIFLALAASRALSPHLTQTCYGSLVPIGAGEYIEYLLRDWEELEYSTRAAVVRQQPKM